MIYSSQLESKIPIAPFLLLTTGYYQTKYGAEKGPDGKPNQQTVGGARILWRGGSIQFENDYLKFDKKDRWRSQAMEITIGNASFGFRLYNNDPKGEGQKTDLTGRDLRGNSNKHGNGAWPSGKVYEAPLWFGYNFGTHIERVGYSHKMIHDLTQNWVHRNGFLGLPFGYQNFYTDYSEFKTGLFYYGGYKNMYSLWGR